MRAAGANAGAQQLSTAGLPVTTAEAHWAWGAELAAAADLVAVNVNPFYAGRLDTSKPG